MEIKKFNKILDNVRKESSPFFVYYEENEEEFDTVCNYLDEDTGCGDIVYFHRPTQRFIYVCYDYNEAEVFEAKEIARIGYDIDEVRIPDQNFIDFIESDFCGELEEYHGNNRYYAWFNFIEK